MMEVTTKGPNSDYTEQEKNDICDKMEELCPIEGEFDMIAKSFDAMGLKEEVAHGICSYGYTRPSPIQSRAIPPLIQGRDVIAQAQSGTGKTATFVIASLQRLEVDQASPVATQVLVLAPTRELAEQIWAVYMSIGQHMSLKCVNLIGGTSVQSNVNMLSTEGAHVVVGTPGRILHMINSKDLKCDKLKVLIMDEADQMLNVGFVDQIRQMFLFLPKDVQVVLLSATMSEAVMEITKSFMRDPVNILVKKEQLTLQVIRQFYVIAQHRNNKVDAILDFMGYSNIPQTVIFVNTQKDALMLSEALTTEGLPVEYLHSGLSQSERTSIMSRFRSSSSKALVSTDLLARGIDIYTVALVINFDIPRLSDTYLHRIGRSGRFGRRGIAINLILPQELSKIKELEAFYKTTISELPENFKEYF